MLLNEDDDKSIAELLSAMAPPVPEANLDVEPAATSTTMPLLDAYERPRDLRDRDTETQIQTETKTETDRQNQVAMVVQAIVRPQPVPVQAPAAKPKVASSVSGGGVARSLSSGPRKHKALLAPVCLAACLSACLPACLYLCLCPSLCPSLTVTVSVSGGCGKHSQEAAEKSLHQQGGNETTRHSGAAPLRQVQLYAGDLGRTGLAAARAGRQHRA